MEACPLTAGENIQLLARDVVECRDARLEVLRQDLLRHMCEPIRELRVAEGMTV